ncbi:cytosine-specific methyltransferase [Alcaligenes faecalis subsp. faecalis NCIB 8687]|uniref:DNA cytosine methyltransferase n=1 Tax=Alcaligenes faecalis TaxID=511 RepID=UPI000269EABE|nr:DNA cytosine methyltransferase [Alcaligenes faecalis]EJC62448.1 cytosine-specific methyltransferase [Alcaligenes faecalis subsp. faecalis NCIB 8687]RSE63662.1 DNA cytosine methyltransferase [Alcaligenes faecalis]
MSTYKFVDLFSGCGGLSLGLSMAGLQGIIAIEKDQMAFDTFSENFLSERMVPVEKFAWPAWLEEKAWGIDDLLEKHRSDLIRMRGTVQVLAGGPPCQGFSFAGRRREEDPRNQLFEKYVAVVNAVQPEILVLENVPGMKVAHLGPPDEDGARAQSQESFYKKLKKHLSEIGYIAHGKIVDASDFGVPQKRSRLIVIGIKEDLVAQLDGGIMHAFEVLESKKVEVRERHALPTKKLITAADAISDLLVSQNSTQPCIDPFSRPGFEEAMYYGPYTLYQKAMHKHCLTDSMDSMRLARHRDDVRDRFRLIIKECTQGVRMNEESRARFGLKKHRIFPMSADVPAPTITTLPDDVLHYCEPRILTVRESARLQSFPDWFWFRGKYTTGGNMRTKECPRYTQVGNAVPPLLAEALGLTAVSILDELRVNKPVGTTTRHTGMKVVA